MKLSFPDKIFRYRSLGTTYAKEEIDRAICHQEVFLAAGDSLNDPFDFSPAFQELELKEINKALRRVGTYRPLLTKARFEELVGRAVSRTEFRLLSKQFYDPATRGNIEQQTAKTVVEGLRKSIRVACFSETPKNIPMWAHYGGNSSGVCIVFDFNRSSIEKENTLVPLKVRYENLRPTVSTVELSKFTGRSGSAVRSTSGNVALMERMCLLKSQDWAYEREWRVFTRSERSASYEKLSCLRVSALIFGPLADIGVVMEMKKKYSSKVDIFKARVSDREFDLWNELL